MRYHWGLGVGHLHAHQPTFNASRIPDKPRDTQDDQFADFEPDEPSGENAHAPDTDSDKCYESDNPELDLDDRDLEGWEDVETDSANDDSERDSNDTDEDFVGM
jgi:hypothetical protein